MKIVVVGAGSVGLFYGGKLAHAGYDVRFLMRGGFEEARHEGIRIRSPDGDIHLTGPKVYLDSRDIGPSDLVLVALKATANLSLAPILPPLLHPQTAVLTLQNGLGNEEYLSDLVGAERILGGLCFVCLNRETLASVIHIGHGSVAMGEYKRPPLPRTKVIHQALVDSGVHSDLVEDLAAARWRKLVWNIPFNGLAVAHGGIAVGRILADPALHAECRALMEEVIRTAHALGHAITPDYADRQIEQTYPMGEYRPSTVIDYLAGRELEIEPIWGEPLRAAEKAGVSTPRLRALYTQLQAANHACRRDS